jgi:hypothetical protein
MNIGGKSEHSRVVSEWLEGPGLVLPSETLSPMT